MNVIARKVEPAEERSPEAMARTIAGTGNMAVFMAVAMIQNDILPVMLSDVEHGQFTIGLDDGRRWCVTVEETLSEPHTA
jgi:hypothetical protein